MDLSGNRIAPEEQGQQSEGGASKRLLELRRELERAEENERDLLGAVNSNLEEKARLRATIDALDSELKSGISRDRAAPAPAASGDSTPPASRTAIEVRHLSKSFHVPIHRSDTLKEQVLHPLRSRRAERLEALRDVSFDVPKGEFLGIAGPNASGKSTLLKIIAGIYAVDEGTVRTAGRVAPFIELGAGMNMELTARDNVIISGVLMGLELKEARARYDDVIEFSGLVEFTEMKLKNYSSGMAVRLAFSVMAQVDADILLVDEVLAVGDAEFRERCLDRLHDLRASGTTIVLVSHAMEALIEHCDRGLLLHEGRLLLDGNPREVAARYGDLAHQPA